MRLNVVPIDVPALRERVGDIPLLVEYFIDRFGEKAGKKFRTIDKKSPGLLQAYDWPGNIRELQNVRACRHPVRGRNFFGGRDLASPGTAGHL